MSWSTIFWILGIWAVISIPAGMLIGRAIRNMNRNDERLDEIIDDTHAWRTKDAKKIAEKSGLTKPN